MNRGVWDGGFLRHSPEYSNLNKYTECEWHPHSTVVIWLPPVHTNRVGLLVGNCMWQSVVEQSATISMSTGWGKGAVAAARQVAKKIIDKTIAPRVCRVAL